ncbi:MAG: molybdopterin converting factor subunit 1 [Rhizobiales bacterium]|nr:molybdopterin converting factor subunit 1 [Hyphomicrobiales bacterium]MBA70061.1 molybdopterin converting factor subunit 1 [Hyphomicrobiales bacterium]|tara:strand:+ start:659 stop:910 length:252 start_codon:yes stop_codon:yes gene_type:complete
MKLIYFAWVRERIGKADEEIDLPEGVATIRELIDFLKTRGEEYEAAFEFPEVIRAAIDHEHVEHSEKIGAAREIALFPPMTGG